MFRILQTVLEAFRSRTGNTFYCNSLKVNQVSEILQNVPFVLTHLQVQHILLDLRIRLCCSLEIKLRAKKQTLMLFFWFA